MNICSNATDVVCSWITNTPAPPYYSVYFIELALGFVFLILTCIVGVKIIIFINNLRGNKKCI